MTKRKGGGRWLFGTQEHLAISEYSGRFITIRRSMKQLNNRIFGLRRTSLVEKVIFKNDRIINIDLKLRTAISIIQVYAPQQGRLLKDKEEFYELLQTTMGDVMYQDSMILCGDWNGHIGCDRKQYETVLGIHSIGNRNEEGKRILDFAVVNNLCIMNTFYQHREPKVNLVQME